MERLTEWNEQTEQAELLSWDEEEWKDFMGSLDVPIATEISIAINKLAEYEDAEEQGLLLRLPCKVGDIFWELNRLSEPPCCYPRYANSVAHCVYVLARLGKTVFLTKEEAEAALEKCRKGEIKV